MSSKVIYGRRLSNCAICPFRAQNKVWGKGDKYGKIVFIGEAPGEEEDRLQEPFVGRAGKALTKMIESLGVSEYWKTNIVTGRPPKNNFHHNDTILARRACQLGLFEELTYLYKLGYQVLIPLGNNAASSLGFSSPISSIRGRVYAYDTIYENLKAKPRELTPSGLVEEALFRRFSIVPAWHPSYIIRNIGKLEEAESKEIWQEWKRDLRTAVQLSNDLNVEELEVAED